jgi:LmbE family N-acetylglucosaminyl deacetylase
MQWTFLSPHFDDIALSCGGLVWELTQAGAPVSVWTICGGDPPRRELSAFAQAIHERWETGTQAVEQRRAEDRLSCAAMHASYRLINNPDCIYRPRTKTIPHYYPAGADIFGKVHPAERKNLVRRLARIFQTEISPSSQIVCPLTLGHHVDHQITRKAAEKAASHFEQPILYYADYPYVKSRPDEIDLLRQQGWECVRYPISKGGMEAWWAAIAAHKSQISTFWVDLEQMQADIEAYSSAQGGLCLWKAPSRL